MGRDEEAKQLEEDNERLQHHASSPNNTICLFFTNLLFPSSSFVDSYAAFTRRPCEKPRQAKQNKASKDKRSGSESDPNRIDDPGYIVRLVGQVITVSVETVQMVNELAQAVRVEDWLGETVEMKE